MCENDTIVRLKPTTTRLGALRSANKKHSMDLWKHMEVCFAKQMPMTLAEVEPAILVPKTNALSIRPQGGMKDGSERQAMKCSVSGCSFHCVSHGV